MQQQHAVVRLSFRGDFQASTTGVCKAAALMKFTGIFKKREKSGTLNAVLKLLELARISLSLKGRTAVHTTGVRKIHVWKKFHYILNCLRPLKIISTRHDFQFSLNQNCKSTETIYTTIDGLKRGRIGRLFLVFIENALKHTSLFKKS